MDLDTVHACVELIKTRWSLPVLYQLRPSPRRYTELLDTTLGNQRIPTKSLAATLHHHEHHGVIEHVHGTDLEVYRLTPLGRELLDHFHDFAEWVSAHRLALKLANTYPPQRQLPSRHTRRTVRR